jgi:hypothetical protein
MVSDNERHDWQVEKFANAALKEIGISGFVTAHRPQVTGNPRLWIIQITTDDGSAHELEVEIFTSDPDEVTHKKIAAAVYAAIEGNKQ